jgi:uncharacterized protein DUF1259
MQKKFLEGDSWANTINTLATIALGTVMLLANPLAMGQVGNSTSSNDAAGGWKQVEDAMGRPGQMQPGDVIKFGMPRKDLHIVLNGVDIKPGLALGSWAAFKRDASGAMVMGDLVSHRGRGRTRDDET